MIRTTWTAPAIRSISQTSAARGGASASATENTTYYNTSSFS